MIKIIHLISSMDRGGRERQLATIVANTRQDNYPTKIVFFNKRANSYVDEYNLLEHTIHIKAKGKRNRLRVLNDLFKEEKPDIVFTWGNGESILALLLNSFHPYKFINGSVRHGIRSRQFSHYFRTFILHLSPHIVANSKAGLKANNLRKGEVLYNGIAPRFIGSLEGEARLEKRRDLLPSYTQAKAVIVSVANLVPYKDYFSSLKALKSLKEQGYDFYYLILGDGPLREQVKSAITEYNLEEEVRLLGNVQNVDEYLRTADIFLHSSKGEGCSNAILEAMAAGLPIVATATGGTLEIVSAENGELFSFKDAGQIEQKLKLYLEDKAKREEAGKRSAALVKEYYTLNRMMHNYYSINQKIYEQA